MGPSSSKVRKAWGHGAKGTRIPDPRSDAVEASNELHPSSVAFHGPGGGRRPGEKGKGHLPPQRGSRILEEIHVDSRRRRAGRVDAGHQTEVTIRAPEDGRLEGHSMTQGL